MKLANYRVITLSSDMSLLHNTHTIQRGEEIIPDSLNLGRVDHPAGSVCHPSSGCPEYSLIIRGASDGALAYLQIRMKHAKRHSVLFEIEERKIV